MTNTRVVITSGLYAGKRGVLTTAGAGLEPGAKLFPGIAPDAPAVWLDGMAGPVLVAVAPYEVIATGAVRANLPNPSDDALEAVGVWF